MKNTLELELNETKRMHRAGARSKTVRAAALLAGSFLREAAFPHAPDIVGARPRPGLAPEGIRPALTDRAALIDAPLNSH